MTNFVKAWRKHLQESDDNEALRRKVLNEISEYDYEYIKDWMSNAPDEAYSFNNLFKGKKRIAITPPPSPAKGPIGNIVRFFNDNGYEIDFKDSVVTKDVTTVIPKGPRAGEKVTKKQKTRIGKAFDVIGNIIKQYKKANEEYKEAGGFAAESAMDIAGFDQKDPDDVKLKKAIEKKEAMENKLTSVLPESAPSYEAIEAQLPGFKQFWNTKSQFYRENPQAAFTKEDPYITILSRHPVDVVRMSDMEDIRSCHSRTGGYFQCAVAESRGHGPIAYSVPRKQFEDYFEVDLNETNPEDVDLDQGDEEIFTDTDRDIFGMTPFSRVRLRKFVHDEDNRMLAVPETRTYTQGNRQAPPGFLKSVVDWAVKSQEKAYGDIEKLANDVSNEKWTRYGGTYRDTSDGGIFAAMFKGLTNDEQYEMMSQAGDIGIKPEDEKQIQQDIDDPLEREVNEIMDSANNSMKYFTINASPDNYDEANPVTYSSEFAFDTNEEFGDYPDPDPDNPFSLGRGAWALNDEEIKEATNRALEEHFGRGYDVLAKRNPIGSDGMYRTEIMPDYNYFRYNLRGLRSWAQNFEDADDSFDIIMNNIREELEEKGIIKDRIANVPEVLKTLDKVRAIINDDAKEINVTFKQRIPITKDIREFKELSAENQRVLKALWAREFGTELRENLNFVRKKVNFPIKNFVVKKERQRLSPELDGIYPIMDFDLLYFDDDDLYKASKLLEEFNKSSYQMSLNQQSAYAYYDLLKDAEKGENPFTKEVNEARKVTDKTLVESWKRFLKK
jgi:rRNA processing protein Gar1